MGSLFRTGYNCWRVGEARGAKVHIESEDYFRALYEHIPLAENSILIAGWDFDFRTNLTRDDFSVSKLRDLANENSQIGTLLEAQLAAKPDLNVYLLIWAHPAIYSTDREIFVEAKTWLTMSSRIHFVRDNQHPFAASQHQKFVIIDNKVVFVGGIDISSGRWDSKEHTYQDPRRNDDIFEDYGPYHDVQMQMQGPVVMDFIELFRERWSRVSTLELPEIKPSNELPLFRDDYDFLDQEVAIARTHPKFRNEKPVREIEHLYWDMIEAAKEEIYIENQYLASEELVERLCQRLADPKGPRITIVLPGHPMAMIEQRSMGAFKNYMVRRLKESAVDERRIEIFYPQSGRGAGSEFKVHSKLMIVDDRILRVGSSNLNNRSMGLDREVDVAIELPQADPAIRKIKIQLLRNFLALSDEELTQELDENPNINLLGRKYQEAERRLIAVEPRGLSRLDRWIRRYEIIDTKKTTKFERVLEQVFSEDSHLRWLNVVFSILGAFLFAGVISLGIFGTNAYDLFTNVPLPRAVALIESLQEAPATWLWVTLLYGVLGAIIFPLNLFILALATIYEPLSAIALALSGALLAGSISFVFGKYAGPTILQKISWHKFDRLTNLLATSGWLPVALIRMIPIAPYSISNIACGAFQIRYRDFIAGSIAGLLPGIVVIVIFQNRLITLVRHPSLITALTVLLIVVLAFYFLRTLRQRFLGGPH